MILPLKFGIAISAVAAIALPVREAVDASHPSAVPAAHVSENPTSQLSWPQRARLFVDEENLRLSVKDVLGLTCIALALTSQQDPYPHLPTPQQLAAEFAARNIYPSQVEIEATLAFMREQGDQQNTFDDVREICDAAK